MSRCKALIPYGLALGGVLAAILLSIVITGPGTAQGAALTSRSGFSGTETVLTFSALPDGTLVTDQFASQGVTFGGTFMVHKNTFDSIWPGSGSPVAANFPACCSEVTATFTTPVTRAGFDIISNDADFVELRAYSNGVLVESTNFDTRRCIGEPADFIGLDVPGGFDTLVISGNGTMNGAWALDDFRYEGRGGSKANGETSPSSAPDSAGSASGTEDEDAADDKNHDKDKDHDKDKHRNKDKHRDKDKGKDGGEDGNDDGDEDGNYDGDEDEDDDGDEDEDEDEDDD